MSLTARLLSNDKSGESKEARIANTAHYFDLDKTLTKTKLQYKEKDRNKTQISDNLKPEIAQTFRNLLRKDCPVAIITRGNTYRVFDVLMEAGLTEYEISRIAVYAENKDDGSECDENFKKTVIKNSLEKYASIEQHFFYDDDPNECNAVDELAGFARKRGQSIMAYQVSRDSDAISHFHFARKISSHPELKIKIADEIYLCEKNDATHSIDLELDSDEIRKSDFDKIIKQYKSTSCLAGGCLFSPYRSTAIKELDVLSSSKSMLISSSAVASALKKDSQRRKDLFFGKGKSNNTSTDAVIHNLSAHFSRRWA